MKYEINYKIFDEYQKKYPTSKEWYFLKDVIKNKKCLYEWLYHAFIWSSVKYSNYDFWPNLVDKLTHRDDYIPELHFEKDYKTFIDYLQNTKHVKTVEPCYEI